MANASLKAAFERMWQHILIKIETELSEHASEGSYLIENVDYGTELPAEAPKGKVFFLKV